MSEFERRLIRFNRTKRALDVVLVLVAAPILIVLGVIAAAIASTSGARPVLFRQQRIGLDEHQFVLLKLRTMNDARDEDGQLLPDRQRLTPGGRLLRRTSLDELPQVVNVLRGDMSIIGPRPLLVGYLPHYRESERLRHRVRPGITGLAQVSGRNGLLWDERLRLDSEYVSQASLRLDATILARTVAQVFAGSGVSVIASDSGEPLDVVRSYPSTAQYALRRFESSDVRLRVEWFTHPTANRHMTLPEQVTEASTHEWLERARRDPDRRDFVVYDVASAEVVAMLGIRQTEQADLPELYILVAPDRHGVGIGSVALHLLIEWMVESAYAGCRLSVSAANTGAIRLYESLDFEVVAESAGRLEMERRFQEGVS